MFHNTNYDILKTRDKKSVNYCCSYDRLNNIVNTIFFFFCEAILSTEIIATELDAYC